METPKIKFDKNSQVRKGRRTKIFFVTILLILAGAVGIVALLRRPNFQISHINVLGTQSLDPAAVESLAEKYISGNYVLVIPRTNALLFSKLGMRNFLVSKIPSLQYADVVFSDRNILTITIAEKKPQYVWCADPAHCYFVDQNGIIYEEAPLFSPGVFITFTGTASALQAVDPNPIGEHFASPAGFAWVTQILTDLSRYPLHVLGVQYLLDTNTFSGDQPINEGDVSIIVDQIKNTIIGLKTQLIVTNTETSSTIANALDLLSSDQNFSEALTANPSSLNYIDLRFPGKIYYKFGNAALATPVVQSAVSGPAPVIKTPATSKAATKATVVTKKKP